MSSDELLFDREAAEAALALFRAAPDRESVGQHREIADHMRVLLDIALGTLGNAEQESCLHCEILRRHEIDVSRAHDDIIDICRALAQIAASHVKPGREVEMAGVLSKILSREYRRALATIAAAEGTLQ